MYRSAAGIVERYWMDQYPANHHVAYCSLMSAMRVAEVASRPHVAQQCCIDRDMHAAAAARGPGPMLLWVLLVALLRQAGGTLELESGLGWHIAPCRRIVLKSTNKASARVANVLGTYHLIPGAREGGRPVFLRQRVVQATYHADGRPIVAQTERDYYMYYARNEGLWVVGRKMIISSCR